MAYMEHFEEINKSTTDLYTSLVHLYSIRQRVIKYSTITCSIWCWNFKLLGIALIWDALSKVSQGEVNGYITFSESS